MDEIFKAIAGPNPRRILELLCEREMMAGQRAEQFQLSKPTHSGHFAVLREPGLFIAGLALFGAALLAVPSSLGVPLIVAAGLICTVLCVLKSWLLCRQEVLHG